ncbi:chondroitin sulfate N-acetylgalactosaminyltransferase 1 [Triplophysa rosa]|uniref:chondroitin sulfate N-acetylgalactosaminyltransferase 1 n=1 Tax=Triplophysa rosa TaxID=992332 RepID=UPI0025463660|nr:chondroitin sulfate N-acetylgalactosaminyltransferase 1 [Triplophysa rosa]
MMGGDRERTHSHSAHTYKLNLYLQNRPDRTRTHKHQRSSQTSCETLLHRHEEKYLQFTTNLSKEISRLKNELRDRSAVIISLNSDGKAHSDLEVFMQKQLRSAEIASGKGVSDELTVVPFDSFTLHRVYQLETGLARHPVERPLRPDRRNELDGALESALHVLNDHQPGDSRHRTSYSPKDFFEGIFRTERDKGTLYDLTFRENTSPDFRRLVFFRPFAPLVKVLDEFIDASQILINIILPLTKQLDAFRRFMQNFSDVCFRRDEQTHLTVVLFGSENMDEVKRILDETSRMMKYRNLTLVHLNEDFSRARGLQVGAHAWSQSNVLFFFCDFNVHFTAEFLNSCRMNAAAGKKVFYPVMFSHYNPEIIYGHHVPPHEEQPAIRKDSGFWKDFDFGMTCQYRSDFTHIGGFEAHVKGRAAEDLHLYRKYLHSGLEVIRAPSRGLFHMWTETVCAEHLSSDAFKVCLCSKALNEASLAHMGDLLYQQQINNHLQKYNKHNRNT